MIYKTAGAAAGATEAAYIHTHEMREGQGNQEGNGVWRVVSLLLDFSLTGSSMIVISTCATLRASMGWIKLSPSLTCKHVVNTGQNT